MSVEWATMADCAMALQQQVEAEKVLSGMMVVADLRRKNKPIALGEWREGSQM